MGCFKTILGYDVDEDVVELILEVNELFPTRKVLIHEMELYPEETNTTETPLGPAVAKLNLRDYIGIWIRTDNKRHIFNTFLRHELIHFIQQNEKYEIATTYNSPLAFTDDQNKIIKRIRNGFTNFVLEIDNDTRLRERGGDVQGLIDYLWEDIDENFEGIISENSEFLKHSQGFYWDILNARVFYFYLNTWRIFQHLSDNNERWEEYDRKFQDIIHPSQYEKWNEILDIIRTNLPRDRISTQNLISKILSEIFDGLSLEFKYEYIRPEICIELSEPVLIPS